MFYMNRKKPNVAPKCGNFDHSDIPFGKLSYGYSTMTIDRGQFMTT